MKLNALFRRKPDDRPFALYNAVVAEARDPAWYRAGMPDTIDGRFDAVATAVCAALLRIEGEPGDPARVLGVRLTELFIANMDSELRQLGTGDMVVGKNVGKLVGQLGGRLGALRDEGATDAFVARNMLRDVDAGPERTRPLVARLEGWRARLVGTTYDDLAAGRVAP